ncbi:hypothetical protein PCANC_23805 [Puccinia coronata f. sp. avenae]|uniref:Uncharacterized protein n=1 Tax=Puccinia coronata f. sp. avenae TaxID=200324 RepID=A0A2N5SIF5_9BASI|nr:hypothetical protein PCANC_23805 [Puccinia coronata f. sp. avenae]PLW13040.1 hypothetical protein PCASD_19967 [Puccinia coronata f. sp. avenae]
MPATKLSMAHQPSIIDSRALEELISQAKGVVPGAPPFTHQTALPFTFNVSGNSSAWPGRQKNLHKKKTNRAPQTTAETPSSGHVPQSSASIGLAANPMPASTHLASSPNPRNIAAPLPPNAVNTTIPSNPPPQMVSDLRGKSVTDLRGVELQFAKGRRLTQEIKDQLREITLDYQKKVHILAIQNEMHSNLLFKWLGAYNQSKGPNLFNQLCSYGQEARKIFDAKLFPPTERMQAVAEIWRAMDEDDRLQYDDWDFINTLRAKMGLRPLKEGLPDDDNADEIDYDNEDHALPIATAATIKHCAKWAAVAVKQMNHMNATHQVEGFFVLASTDVEGTVFELGGSPLGESYLKLLESRNNPWKQFRVWAAGLEAQSRLSGLPVGPIRPKPKQRKPKVPWDLVDCHKNCSSMTNQLRECLETITRGKRTNGWPGKDTLQSLKAWGVCFRIKPKAVNLRIKDLCMPTKNINAGKVLHILEALHKGWFVLASEEDDENKIPNSYGCDNLQSQDINDEEEEDKDVFDHFGL